MNKDQVYRIALPNGAYRKQFKMQGQFGRDQVAAAVNSFGWNSFERPFPEYYFKYARLFSGSVLDVGANTGFYTLLAACASSKNNIFSFEPDQAILRSLDENVRLSGVRSQVKSFPLALSDKSGEATLFIPTQEHGLIETSSSLESTFKSEHSATLQVKIDTLDSFVHKHCRQTSISIIKIDVEGHEPAVLAGGQETIRSQRPLIFVEVLGRADLVFFTEFIKRHDYVDIPLHERENLRPTNLIEFIPDAWNHAFVPKEKLKAFLDLAPT